MTWQQNVITIYIYILQLQPSSFIELVTKKLQIKSQQLRLVRSHQKHFKIMTSFSYIQVLIK